MTASTATPNDTPTLTGTTTQPLDPAIRTFRHDAASFPAALRSEWIKASTLRSTRGIVALTVLVGLVTSWATATFVTDEVLTVAQVFIYSTWLTTVLATIAGTLVFTSEVQHGTLATIMTAQTARWVIVAAKTITAAVFGLLLGATGMAAGAAGAFLGGLDTGATGGIPATVGWALALTAVAAVLGLGVGMIVGHSSAAIAGLLVWALVVEGLLTALAPASLTRFLPFFAGNGLLLISERLDSPEKLAVELTRIQNAVVFGGYATAVIVVGAVVASRRDVN